MTTVQNYDEAYESAIAIIGMAGRFPDAASVEQLWDNLIHGVRSIRHFSDEELTAAGVESITLRHPQYVKAGTVVPQVDQFDAAFFGFNPRETETMDPQHRLFLECAWEALERSAYAPEEYQGLIGVFAGSAPSSYRSYNLFSNHELIDHVGGLQLAVGNDHDSLASTVSHRLNLRGPSVAVQTFCSTSLVAVHLACQSLLTYECSIALAGGAAISIPQSKGYLYEEGGILSPDGVCRTFDGNAQGSVMGSGVGVIALKRFEEALEDGDQIYAIIRSSAVNNDGIQKVGYTAPGLAGQSSIITRALSRADLTPEQISYIEAHGTATSLGDAVELAAMIKAFQSKTSKKQFCAIGSVKPNIGHLDRASGITGLIKTTMALRHRQLPPQLDFESSSPEINLAQSPFYVNTAQAEWPANGAPRRAGVSSFGLGGTNAHVVLEEAPAQPPSDDTHTHHLFILSAKTSNALEAMSARLAEHLRAEPTLNPTDVAYTLQMGRSTFNHRRAVVATGLADVVIALETANTDRVLTSHQTYRNRSVVFLFPDADSVYQGVAQDLYAKDALFRTHVDRCSELFRPLLSMDIAHLIAHGQTILPNQAGAIAFTIAYALAHRCIDLGIVPKVCIGKGIGDYVAACLAEVMTLEEAIQLVVLYEQSAAFEAKIRQIDLKAPTLPFLSALSGTWISTNEATDPHYWLIQRQNVAPLHDTIIAAWDEPSRVLLEVGPGQTLGALATRHAEAHTIRDRTVVATLDVSTIADSADTTLLRTLANLWLAGVPINWMALYPDEQRRRIALPTYPFEYQRYWVEANPSATFMPASTKPVEEGKKADIADWFYTPLWRQSPLFHQPDVVDSLRQQGPWLVFSDDSSLAHGLVAQLREARCRTIVVYAGTSWVQRSPDEITLDPSQEISYVRLLSSLGCHPHTIVHLWGCKAHTDSKKPSAHFNQLQQYGFYSLLYLAKAITKLSIVDTIHLWAFSSGTHSITGEEKLNPAAATIAGACRVIPQENMSVTCHHVDIDKPRSRSWQEQKLLDQLFQEFVTQTTYRTIAYRNIHRWVQHLEPIRLEQTPDHKQTLRQHGTYLITGGLGDIGLVLARHLARTVQARLVLVGRSRFPDRSEWSHWLATHADDNKISRRIRAVQELEQYGSQVLIFSADVASKKEIRSIVEATEAQYGQIHGVIYTAGISEGAGFGTIQDVDRASCELQFQPKVHGLYVLEDLFHDYPLDFCVVYSSIASILGGLSFIGYTAANCFIDSFVQTHNQTNPYPWVSVNWDTWQVREFDHGGLGATVEVYAMSPSEGIEALERVLASEGIFPQIVQSTGDIQSRLSQWVTDLPQSTLQHEDISTLHARPDIGIPYAAPTNEIEEKIADVWQNVLGIAEVGIHDNFLDLGGNSLIGMQIVSRLRQTFRTNIPLTILFDAPTVAEMAVAIELQIIEEIENMDDEQVLSMT